jgi:hypothetical protein
LVAAAVAVVLGVVGAVTAVGIMKFTGYWKGPLTGIRFIGIMFAGTGTN